MFAGPAAMAQQNFDAVVSGVDVFGGCFILPYSESVVQWVNPLRVEYGDVEMVASADGRRVLALMRANPLRIVEIRPDGSQLPFFNGQADTPSGVSMTIASNGRVFVSTASVTTVLARISAAGVLEATYPLPGSNIAVGPDGCTIYYFTSNGIIRRMNGCTGAALPDFATPAGAVEDIEVLPSGQVLVSAGTQVSLYDTTGALVRVVADLNSYGLTDRYATAIAERGGVLFIAAVDPCDAAFSVLLRVGLADGSEISREELFMTNANAIVINAAALAIPTLGEVAFALLVFALAAAGALMLKLR